MHRNFFAKILKDLLVALIATYFLLLIPELILPGIVSSHFNPKFLLVFILFLGIAFSKLKTAPKKPENPKFQAISRNLINIILFVIAIMLVLSLYKMALWQIAVVVAVSIPLLLAAEKVLVEE
jgi:cell division protein FtsW (lipid II flippase)